MKAIADSTPLIHLAKIGKIEHLKKIFEKIIIPKTIYEEVIERGKDNSEVPIIKKLIEEKFIIIKESKTKIEMPNLHEGEKEALSLCKELKIENILIDEKEGFNISLMLNLTPIRTSSIFMILLDKKMIKLREYEESLKGLSESGYFLDLATYKKLIEIGKRLV